MRLTPTARLRLILALVAFDLVLAIGIGVWAFTRPQPVDLADARLPDVTRTLNHMETLFGQIACQPSLVVGSLAEVMADEPGFALSQSQRQAVVDVFGEQNLPVAGVLTYYMAYYRIRRGAYAHTDPTLPPGLRPTQPPSIRCPDPAADISVNLRSAAEKDDRLIVEYAYGPYTREATLTQTKGRWFVVDLEIKLVSD